ncbi:hypothetical protein [uncultured Corynebacterium sp.]
MTGIVGQNPQVVDEVNEMLSQAQVLVPVKLQPEWYF